VLIEFSGILLIALGVLFVTLGLTSLWASRQSVEAEDGEPRGMSRPTRTVIGMVFLIAGYHLIVWALPREMTTLQLSRDIWYALVIGCIGAVLASRWLDRLENRSGLPRDDRRERRDGQENPEDEA
jgi:UDP-N-acetylmuramyl pentapeptide phosphotransferase/UDP-N-acetylglucosamine-1-phosphate transferase